MLDSEILVPFIMYWSLIGASLGAFFIYCVNNYDKHSDKEDSQLDEFRYWINQDFKRQIIIMIVSMIIGVIAIFAILIYLIFSKFKKG